MRKETLTNVRVGILYGDGHYVAHSQRVNANYLLTGQLLTNLDILGFHPTIANLELVVEGTGDATPIRGDFDPLRLLQGDADDRVVAPLARVFVGRVHPHAGPKIAGLHQLSVHEQDAHVRGGANHDDGRRRRVIRLLGFGRRGFGRGRRGLRRREDDRAASVGNRVVVRVGSRRGGGASTGKDGCIGSPGVLIEVGIGRGLAGPTTPTHRRHKDHRVGRSSRCLRADAGRARSDRAASPRTTATARTRTRTSATATTTGRLTNLGQIRQAELTTLRAKDAKDRKHRRSCARNPGKGNNDRDAHRIFPRRGSSFGIILQFPSDIVDVLLDQSPFIVKNPEGAGIGLGHGSYFRTRSGRGQNRFQEKAVIEDILQVIRRSNILSTPLNLTCLTRRNCTNLILIAQRLLTNRLLTGLLHRSRTLLRQQPCGFLSLQLSALRFSKRRSIGFIFKPFSRCCIGFIFKPFSLCFFGRPNPISFFLQQTLLP